MSKPTLTPADFERAAKELNCEVAAIRAVAQVESAGPGFLSDGQPVILFEAHVFDRLTGGRFRATHPNLSSARWNKALYGRGGQHQHNRLAAAVALDRNAALQAASYGKFQALGEGYKTCGYSDLQGFINGMYRSEQDHLWAFCQFIRRKHPRLLPALQNKDWATVAYYYNGAGYRANAYDVKMAQAYKRFNQ